MEAAAGLYYAAMQPWPRKDKLGGTVVIAVLVSHLDKQPEASHYKDQELLDWPGFLPVM